MFHPQLVFIFMYIDISSHADSMHSVLRSIQNYPATTAVITGRWDIGYCAHCPLLDYKLSNQAIVFHHRCNHGLNLWDIWTTSSLNLMWSWQTAWQVNLDINSWIFSIFYWLNWISISVLVVVKKARTHGCGRWTIIPIWYHQMRKPLSLRLHGRLPWMYPVRDCVEDIFHLGLLCTGIPLGHLASSNPYANHTSHEI